MTKHFTRNTVSVEFYCSKCKAMTQHRIDGGRKGPCLKCIAKLESEHGALKPKSDPVRQEKLFE